MTNDTGLAGKPGRPVSLRILKFVYNNLYGVFAVGRWNLFKKLNLPGIVSRVPVFKRLSPTFTPIRLPFAPRPATTGCLDIQLFTF
jgi:hypothetical protein